jgi:hypothetical protein
MMLAAIELERPSALLLLALPVALLLLLRLRARPEEDATGTLEIWRRAAAQQPATAARTRRRIPLSIWLLCGSLACAVCAAASPRVGDHESGVLIVVDRTPSMYLDAGGETRLARALSLARPWIEQQAPEHVTWTAPPQWYPRATGEDGITVLGMGPATGAKLPSAWEQAPAAPRDDVDWIAFDRPGCVWITDRAPEFVPRYAGWFASGGPAVTGAVGVRDGMLFEWDGARLTESSQAVPARSVSVRGKLPDVLMRALRAWASARGLSVTGFEDPAPSLALFGGLVGGGAPHDIQLGRDGWSARATVDGEAPRNMSSFEVEPVTLVPMETWLSDEAGAHAWVTFRPGAIYVAIGELGPIEHDAAAFAVSWAQLFDRCVVQPSGCVSLAERMDAGPSGRRLPVEPVRGESLTQSAAVKLGCLALVLAALALVSSGKSALHGPVRSRESAGEARLDLTRE